MEIQNNHTDSPNNDEGQNLSPDERVNRLNEALKHAENIENLTNAISIKAKTQSEDDFAKLLNQKRQLLEEMTNQENQLKDKRTELEMGNKRGSPYHSKTLPYSKYEAMNYIQNKDDDECTFQPRINHNSARMSNRIYQPEENIADMLYKDAYERISKEKDLQKAKNEEISRDVNKNKIDTNSLKLIMRRIEKTLRSIISDNESTENKGNLDFEGIGVILHNIGAFQNLEFEKGDKGDKSSLSLNELKIKPERLSQEIIFHENFWNTLNSSSTDPNLVNAELVFDFLMVLVEKKAPIKSASACLEEIIEKFFVQKGEEPVENGKIYSRVQQEKKLWSLEKIIVEFRKLFEDNTTFMNLYNNASILGKQSFSLEKQSQEEHNRIPTINKRSKELDSQYQTETYITKVITSKETDEGKNSFKNRHDILYEHHKLIKAKQQEKEEASKQDVLKGCTFKPTIKEYDASLFPKTEAPRMHSHGSTYMTISKDKSSKRHDVLYQSAKLKKEKMEQIKYELKQRETELEMQNCTFQPKLNSQYEYSDERNRDFYETIPNGYKKIVERMQAGEMKRKQELHLKEKIPVGENYEKNKDAEFKPPTFLKRPKIKRQEVLVYVDVNVAPGKTGRIGIHKGDDPKKLALSFSRTYSLNASMRESLEKLLQSYIDSYFPENPPENEDDRKIEEEEEDQEEEEEEGDGENNEENNQQNEEENGEENEGEDNGEENEEENEDDS